MRTIGKYLAGYILFAVITASVHAQDAWKEYSSNEYMMAYSMPADPTASAQTVDTALGKITLQTYILEQGSSVLMVMVNVYPDKVVQTPPKKLLEKGRDGAVESIKGKVVSEKNIDIEGNPGLEFEFKSAQYHGIYRIYLVGRRMYQVGSVSAVGTPLLPGTDRFMSSFRLVKP